MLDGPMSEPFRYKPGDFELDHEVNTKNVLILIATRANELLDAHKKTLDKIFMDDFGYSTFQDSNSTHVIHVWSIEPLKREQCEHEILYPNDFKNMLCSKCRVKLKPNMRLWESAE